MIIEYTIFLISDCLIFDCSFVSMKLKKIISSKKKKLISETKNITRNKYILRQQTILKLFIICKQFTSARYFIYLQIAAAIIEKLNTYYLFIYREDVRFFFFFFMYSVNFFCRSNIYIMHSYILLYTITIAYLHFQKKKKEEFYCCIFIVFLIRSN